MGALMTTALFLSARSAIAAHSTHRALRMCISTSGKVPLPNSPPESPFSAFPIESDDTSSTDVLPDGSAEGGKSRSKRFEGYTRSEPKGDAYVRARELGVAMPCIILVNPFLDSNVGSVARAMLNFGLTELRLVDPVCDFKSANARAIAAGAVEILENAKVYKTVEECIGDLNRVMATTIRPRGMNQLIYTPEMAGELMVSSLHNVSSGVMFGRERSGLTNEEVALSDGIINIPAV